MRLSEWIRANILGLAAIFIALGGTAWAVQANSIATKHLKNRAVTSKKLARGAVKAPHLAKGAVRPAKLANGAVRTGKLADGAVTTEKLADGAVSPEALQGEAVQTQHIADRAVGFEKLAGTFFTQGISATYVVPAHDCIPIGSGAVQDVEQGDLLIPSYTTAGGLPNGLYVPVVTAPADGIAPTLLCNHTNDIIPTSSPRFHVRIVKP